MPRVLPIKKRRQPRYGFLCIVLTAVCVLMVTNVLVLRPVLKLYGSIVSTISDETADATNEKDDSSSTTIAKEAQNPTEQEDQDLALCHDNPFASYLSDSLEVIASRRDKWLAKADAWLQSPSTTTSTTATFQNMTSCPSMEINNPCNEEDDDDDEGDCASETRRVCDLEELPETCNIYIMGKSAGWTSESEFLDKTLCAVHSFDCTIDAENESRMPNDPGRFFFHHVCLGAQHKSVQDDRTSCENCGETWTLSEVSERSGQAPIDILVLEGVLELSVLESWSSQNALPWQIVVDLPYETTSLEAEPVDPDAWSKMVALQQQTLRLGYTVVAWSKSNKCDGCTSLTLVRTMCLAQWQGGGDDNDGYEEEEDDEQEEDDEDDLDG